MKWWVLKIFSVNKDLDKLCEKIDGNILKLALNSVLPATVLYEKIAALNQKKADLINLRVLYNMMAEDLTAEELGLIMSTAELSAGDFCEPKFGGKLGKVDVLLKKCVARAVGVGYHSKRLERVYPYLGRLRRAG